MEELCHHHLEEVSLRGNEEINGDQNDEEITQSAFDSACKSLMANDGSNGQDIMNKRNNCEKCLLKSKENYWYKNKHNGCNTGSDSFVFDGHAVTMTKIDVSFGAWGLYNYYRMQVLVIKLSN